MIVIVVFSPLIKGFGTGTGGDVNKRTSEDHPNYSIVEIGKNTE